MLEININIHADPTLVDAINRLAEGLNHPQKSSRVSPAAQTTQQSPQQPQVMPPQCSPVSQTPQQYATTATNRGASVPLAPAQQPAPSQAPAPQMPVSSAPQYTADMIFNACAELVNAGKNAQLSGLLQKYQIARLPDLKPEYYGAFATDLRGLGARI